ISPLETTHWLGLRLGRSTVGESTMRNLLIVLTLITTADLAEIAQAADYLPGAIKVASQRLFRASAVVHGMHCPILPVPDQSPAQEFHP
ncbi:MAG: hypothetical protein ACRDGM_18560, partial [bacterium]